MHLGPGPGRRRRATRPRCAPRCSPASALEITEPGESEDIGKEWGDPAALTEYGDREPTEPWTWAGPPPHGHGPHLGRLHRGPPVDPHRRPLPGRPGRPRRRGAAARDQRGADPRPGVRLDPAVPRRTRAARRRRRRARRPAPGLRLRAPTGRRGPRRAPGRASATPPSRSSTATTPTPSCASASPSGTPDRSGSCPTAARSPSTASPRGLGGLRLNTLDVAALRAATLARLCRSEIPPTSKSDRAKAADAGSAQALLNGMRNGPLNGRALVAATLIR